MAVTARESKLVYAFCPRCGHKIKRPFRVANAVYWEAFTHFRTRNRNCRVLVAIHPTGDWLAYDLPRDVSFEEALLAATTSETVWQ